MVKNASPSDQIGVAAVTSGESIDSIGDKALFKDRAAKPRAQVGAAAAAGGGPGGGAIEPLSSLPHSSKMAAMAAPRGNAESRFRASQSADRGTDNNPHFKFFV